MKSQRNERYWIKVPGNVTKNPCQIIKNVQNSIDINVSKANSNFEVFVQFEAYVV